MNAITSLAAIINQRGPIPSVRVSSAQARGAAKHYAYWGAARYELRLTKSGAVSNCAVERASSDRRSVRLAEADAERIAEREDRIELQTIGTLSEQDAARVLRWMGRAQD